MSVTLSEVKRAARAHRAPLAGESAGYLVLAIADQVLQAPRLVQAADVQLTEEGALRVVSGHASSDVDAELSLRRALDQLLLVASSGSAALTRASRRTAPLGLSSLVRELEAALIPVNRAAARRALARVHRETARALESGTLPEEPAEDVAPIALPVPVPTSVVAAPTPAAAREPQPKTELAPEPEPDHETPALAAPAMPALGESHLNGVVSALCDELPLPPQFVESEPLTSALPVRELPVPVVASAPEPEFLLEIDVELESEGEAVDSSAAPTVMRAVPVAPVALSAPDANSEQPLLDLPLEARTQPEPVILRKALKPLLDLLPEPELERMPETPTLGSLVTQLPILAPEQIAEMSVLTSAPMIDLEQRLASASDDRTERMPEVAELSPGAALTVAGIESSQSRKSDVNELINSFHVAEPDSNPGLCRAIKEMAQLDLTPAPFAALIRER